MELDMRKIIGYALVFVGVAFMILAFYSIYNVFTNAAKPPELFQAKSFTFSVKMEGRLTEANLSLDYELRKAVNAVLFYLFMLFILMFGSRISTLGTQFIRELKIETR